MPIYEFRCPSSSCGIRFSLNGNMSEAGNDRQCPDCGSMSPRVMSRFNSRVAVPFRIMQEEVEHPGQYKELSFSPDCEVAPSADSRELREEADPVGDAELVEKVDKEALEVAKGHKEPPKKEPFRRHFPHMFPHGAPMKGLDPS